jgi:hypothetical protein
MGKTEKQSIAQTQGKTANQVQENFALNIVETQVLSRIKGI